jgi:hypothetical protein
LRQRKKLEDRRKSLDMTFFAARIRPHLKHGRSRHGD